MIGRCFGLTQTCAEEKKETLNRITDDRKNPKWRVAQRNARNHLHLLKEKIGAPGITAAVLLEDKLIYADGVGWSDVENLIPMTPYTPLRIASISKSLTAVAVAKLVEDGKLDVDAPISKYLPDLHQFTIKSPTSESSSDQTKEHNSQALEGVMMTSRQLASHLSGIRHYTGREFYSTQEFKTIKDALSVFIKNPLEHRPGEKFLYTSHGYTLLSAVIEGASGMNYLDYMSKNVFAPLGMLNTRPELHQKLISHRARYYIRDYKEREQKSKAHSPILKHTGWGVDLSMKWAGGGFLSTPIDLIQFSHALLPATDGSQRFLKEDTIKSLLWTPQKLNNGTATNYGLGFFIRENNKHRRNARSSRLIEHSGSAVGGSSQLILLPEDRMAVVMITNIEKSPRLLGKCVQLGEIFLQYKN